MNQETLRGKSRWARGGGVILGFFSGLALGTLLGAVLALFSAPKSGEEMRGQLRETSLQVTERAGVVAGQARDQIGTLQKQAQSALDQARDRAKALTGVVADQEVISPVGAEGAMSDLTTSAP